MKTLRQQVSELMVRRHLIPVELAAYHVAQMPNSEVRRRFLMYVRMGTELSAEANTRERSTCIPPGFHARDDDGTLSALNRVPEGSATAGEEKGA